MAAPGARAPLAWRARRARAAAALNLNRAAPQALAAVAAPPSPCGGRQSSRPAAAVATARRPPRLRRSLASRRARASRCFSEARGSGWRRPPTLQGRSGAGRPRSAGWPAGGARPRPAGLAVGRAEGGAARLQQARGGSERPRSRRRGESGRPRRCLCSSVARRQRMRSCLLVRLDASDRSSPRGCWSDQHCAFRLKAHVQILAPSLLSKAYTSCLCFK